MTDSEAQDIGFLEGTAYQKGYPQIPHCVYFYYLNKDNFDGEPELYFFDNGGPIQEGDIRGIIVSLLENATSHKKQLPPIGWGFDDVRWRKVSYLVIALDDPTQRMNPGDAIGFSINNKTNYSFFDAGDDLFDVGSGESARSISVAWCINHTKKDKAGHKMDKNPHHVTIEMHGASITKLLGGGTGTNMGPPVPPPERK